MMTTPKFNNLWQREKILLSVGENLNQIFLPQYISRNLTGTFGYWIHWPQHQSSNLPLNRNVLHHVIKWLLWTKWYYSRQHWGLHGVVVCHGAQIYKLRLTCAGAKGSNQLWQAPHPGEGTKKLWWLAKILPNRTSCTAQNEAWPIQWHTHNFSTNQSLLANTVTRGLATFPLITQEFPNRSWLLHRQLQQQCSINMGW